jgi:hypothetical protein
MKETVSFGIPVFVYQTTRLLIPEVRNLNVRPRENIRSHMIYSLLFPVKVTISL